MIIDLRAAPSITLSLAASKSEIATSFWFMRAAFSAASLTRLARSAPAKPGAPQRGVEDVGAVGRRHKNDAFVGLESVHLDQKRVERLLAFVVAAAQAGAALAADRVDLVDEDDAGGVLLALLEQIPDARRADPHEHLDEVRAADGEERHVRLARHRAGQQRLAGARRPDEQDAPG